VRSRRNWSTNLKMALNRPIKSGLTVQDLKEEVLDGIPIYNGAKGILPRTMERALASAEDEVEKDIDMVFGKRTIYCIQDQSQPEFPDGAPDDHRIIRPPLDKPKNWFAGDRHGAIRLPLAPAKKIISVHLVYPYGVNQRFPLNTNSFALEKNCLRFKFLYYNNGGAGYPTAAMPNAFFGGSGNASYANTSIPGGVEVVYEAGLTQREIENEWQEIPSMVLMLAAAKVLALVQARVGGTGADGGGGSGPVIKETQTTDNITDSIEFADRSKLGAYGGEITTLMNQYKASMARVNSRKITFGWLG
jgi:hypothetical protein